MPLLRDEDVAIWCCPKADLYQVIEFKVGDPQPIRKFCGKCTEPYVTRCPNTDCPHPTYHPSDVYNDAHPPCRARIPWADARNRAIDAGPGFRSRLVGTGSYMGPQLPSYAPLPEMTPEERQDLIVPPSVRLPMGSTITNPAYEEVRIDPAPSLIPGGSPSKSTSRFDAFLVHASEDKAEVVHPLRDALTRRGYNLWVDEFQLKVGDSLRRKIDQGLKRSAHGIVVLSPSFFVKRWPQEELDALYARAISARRNVILPVWHGVDQKEIKRRAPLIAGRLAANTKDGIDAVADDLAEAMGKPIGLRPRVERRKGKASG